MARSLSWESLLQSFLIFIVLFWMYGGYVWLTNSVPPYAAYEAARYAMGDTLRYAQKMDLIAMAPRGDLASTGFALANPGKEYLVFQPAEKADPFTVMLAAGTCTVERFSINRRETRSARKVNVEVDGTASFTTSFADAGPVVLYLKRASS